MTCMQQRANSHNKDEAEDEEEDEEDDTKENEEDADRLTLTFLVY